MFPSASAFLKNYIWFLPGCFFFYIGLGLTLQYLRDRRKKQIRPANPQPATSIGFLLFGSVFVGSFIAHSVVYTQNRFDPATVDAIQVTRVTHEGDVAQGPPILLADSLVLHTALAPLTHAQGYIRNHEHFADGYHMALRLHGESGYDRHVIEIFRRTSRTQQPVVIIVMGKELYSCPTLLPWLNSTLDPLLDGANEQAPGQPYTFIYRFSDRKQHVS